MSEPVLKITALGVRHGEGEAPALTGVSFAVARGERVALIGPNGCGKTTLLLSVVGLVPFSGEIMVAGTPVVRRQLDEVRRQVGFLFSVPDDQILFPRVLDDVLFGLRGEERSNAEAKAYRMLELLGVSSLAERSPHHLSLGQRKRVALAGTLVTEPSLVLLDEPSSGLDPRGRARLRAQLGRLPSALLIATHDLDFACACCDRALVLQGGQIAGELTWSSANRADAPTRLLEAMYPEGLDPAPAQ